MAWDLYLVYGPGARWTDAVPPGPDFWMHQLGEPGDGTVPQGPFLDPVAFEAEVRRVEADAPRRLPRPEVGESPTGRVPGSGLGL